MNNCSAVGLHLCQSGKEGPRNTRLCNLVAPSKELPKKGFEGEAERHLTGKETESWELIYSTLYKSPLPLVKKVLETAGLMLGTDKARDHCLKMISAAISSAVPTADPSIRHRVPIRPYY